MLTPTAIILMSCMAISEINSSSAALESIKLLLALTLESTSIATTLSIGDIASVNVNVNPSAGVTGQWKLIDLSGNVKYINLDEPKYMDGGLGALIIRDFQLSDAGLYVFKATDGNVTAESLPISVYASGSPSVSTSMSVETANLGQTFTLDCAVFSDDPIIDIKWLHMDMQGRNEYINESNTSKYHGSIPSNPSLTIMGVDINDVGKFWCYAKNDQGTTGISKQITLSLAAATTNQETADLSTTSKTITTNIETTSFVTESESTHTETANATPESGSTNTGYISVATESESIHTETTNATPESGSTNIEYTSVATESESTHTETTYATPESGSTNIEYTSVGIESESTASTFVTTDTIKSFSTSSSDSYFSTSGITTTVTSNIEATSDVMLSIENSVTLNNNVTNTGFEKCQCDCEYQAKIDYWASQNLTGYTLEELRVILRPVLIKLETDLRVNKANLSSTIRKLTCASDDRPTAKQIGAFGVVCLILTIGAVVASDLVSIKSHISNIKQNWRHQEK